MRELWIKRMAQSSTVIVVRTSDPKRLEPFIRFIAHSYERLVDRQKISGYEMYLYRVWSGLFKVSVYGGEVRYEPVSMRTQSAPIPMQLSQQMQRIRDLVSALTFIDNIMNQRDGIVFMLWGLFPKKGAPQEQDALIAFLRNAIFTGSYYGKFHSVIVFADSPESIIDDDTLKHCILVDVPPSFDIERRRIIEDVIRAFNLPEGNIDALVEATKGLTLHETESVIYESFFKYRKLDYKVITSYKHDIVRKSGILDIEEPKYGFEAVGGYDVIKEFIKVNVIKVLKNPKKAERLGLRPPRGILLFGPPGTGKTWFAMALASELGIPFLRLRTEKIVSMWYGETSRNLAKAIKVAESIAPCVLFIDEIDRFGRRGHLTEHEESRRAFSILLEWLGDERRKTIVIGTTNRPEDLDEAFRRVGRFDYMIPFLYPDFEARLEILKVHTSVVRKVPLRNVRLDIIARKTEFWTGAELKELVLRATRMALKEDADYVTMRHFERALSTFRINLNERREQLARYIRLAEDFTNDAEFLENLRRREKSRLEALKEIIEG